LSRLSFGLTPIECRLDKYSPSWQGELSLPRVNSREVKYSLFPGCERVLVPPAPNGRLCRAADYYIIYINIKLIEEVVLAL